MAETANIAGATLREGPAGRPRPLHPAYVRITHFINAIAILAMIGSGWQIYNASPLFTFEFPKAITLGGWLAGGLLWHFAAMWLLVANGFVFVVLGLATGRLRRKWLPLRPADFMHDLRAALAGRLAHGDPAVYNAVQKALYIGVMLAGVVSVLSGPAIWKPVQLRALTVVLGGYEAARLVHFFAMAAIVAFLAVHVVMALVVPKALRAIIVGQ
jgi:thiosulfate reductase cytochrome b subunit